MTTEDALLAAVLASPDEDAIRLVYADALDESGEPAKVARAELIRVQIELTRDLGPNTKPIGEERAREWRLRESRVIRLQQRERDLLFHVRQNAVYYIPPDDRVTFRRGFIEALKLPAATWLAHADAILAEHPIRAVELTTWPEFEEKTIGRLDPSPGWHGPRVFRGTTYYWEGLGRPATEEESVKAMFKIVWPTVNKFTLPQVYEQSISATVDGPVTITVNGVEMQMRDVRLTDAAEIDPADFVEPQPRRRGIVLPEMPGQRWTRTGRRRVT